MTGTPAQFWLACAFGALTFIPRAPVLAEPASSFPDIRAIQQQGKLRIGLIARDSPPLLVTGKNGQPTGIEVSMANGLARRLGVKPAFLRTAATHDELVAQVAAGDVDIALSSISRTASRAQVVRFSRPYLTQSMAVLLNRKRALREGADCPKTPADVAAMAARPRTLGVPRGTSYEQALRGLNKKAAPEVFDDLRKFLHAVVDGTLLAGLGGEISVRQVLKEHPAARIELKLCLVGVQKDRIAIAVRPDRPNLGNWIDVVLEDSGFLLEPSGLFKLATDWQF